MGVGGRVLVVVLELDVVAVAVDPPGLNHGAVAGGIDRGAARRGEIDPLVHARVAEDRMQPHAEPRAEPRPVNRRAQQRLAGVFAALSVK